jgi:hypothetical protein
MVRCAVRKSGDIVTKRLIRKENEGMVLSRIAQKVERVTVTLVPTSDERGYRNVPSTFSTTHRSYEWRRSENMSYMIVPKRISNKEIEVEMFVNPAKKGKLNAKVMQKLVQEFVAEKIESEWRGLRLGGISKASIAAPPEKMFIRGTIEEMLGTNLDQ